VTYKKKLIEVTLPLVAINKASAHEKQPGLGAHPRGLHLWWARRPLATARAVIFAQMVDDPSAHPDLFPTEKAQEKERNRLFKIIEDLVLWKNTINEKVLQEARDEIWQSWRRTCAENADHPKAKELFDRHKLPAFHDPFAGGGGLPLEAQRLGLESYASDLNPVAVLINKAMIEIPPKFAGKPPVNPEAQKERKLIEREWQGGQGLVEDVRYYGRWMRDEAEKRIGHLYPKAEITPEMVNGRPDLEKYKGRQLTVIAWAWARTVICPNPACACQMPLLSSLVLSSKKNKEFFINPIVREKEIYFKIQNKPPTVVANPKNGFKRGLSGIFECVFCGTVTTRNYMAQQATEIGLGFVQTGVVAQGDRCRVYLPAEASPVPAELPPTDCAGLEVELSPNPRDVWCRNFGLLRPMDLFTPRQLVALTTFSDLVLEAIEQVVVDAKAIGWQDDETGLDNGGIGATAYSNAVGVYLDFAISRLADYNSTIATWKPSGEQVMQTFKRQAIPMTWDFPESNVMGKSAICWEKAIKYTADSLLITASGSNIVPGFSNQHDASAQSDLQGKIISTDPPYYDNIGYADLSDFFYVWHRRSLKHIFPSLFATMSVPKADELVATAYRHQSKKEAESFFLDGMTQAIHRLAEQTHPAFPITVYYAFKQSETKNVDSVASTGWETFLDAVIKAGFAISSTWPMRTELTNKIIGLNANMLASSIVLSCRPQAKNAPVATRGEFIAALKIGLPKALIHLQRGNIEPVDLAQAVIGPGMAIYTSYAQVIDIEGNHLSVRQSLALINQILDEVLAEQECDFDKDSRWAITWFEQFGFSEADFGAAEQLSKSKNTSVGGLVEAGIVFSKPGKKVRLWRPIELPEGWDPDRDKRLTNWEMVHHLIRALEADGESAAAKIMAKLGSKAEIARELCYRLYNLCERQKRATEALSYNGLVQSWPEITRLAREGGRPRDEQTDLFDDNEE
jgi:putative DNA methylase